MIDRKRMQWTQNLKISNLWSFKARLNNSEKSFQYTKIQQTMWPLMINTYTAVLYMDSFPLDRIIFLSRKLPWLIISEDYNLTKKQNLRHNRYLTKQWKPTIQDINKDAEMLWSLSNQYMSIIKKNPVGTIIK